MNRAQQRGAALRQDLGLSGRIDAEAVAVSLGRFLGKNFEGVILVSHWSVEHVLAGAAKYGTVTTRRIYGDWTAKEMSGWKGSLPWSRSPSPPRPRARLTAPPSATSLCASQGLPAACS